MTLITDTVISVKQTDCTFQFNKYFSEKSCILTGRIDNASVAFSKSVSIYTNPLSKAKLLARRLGSPKKGNNPGETI